MPHGTSVNSQLGLQSLTESGQVQMTDDPPELLLGLDHPGRAPAQGPLLALP
jgi:hypothetical protein